jgi:putative transposase
MEAYVHGVSTRKVDDLVAALGIEASISKSEVPRICGELDAVVGEFRSWRLDHRERVPRPEDRGTHHWVASQ